MWAWGEGWFYEIVNLVGGEELGCNFFFLGIREVGGILDGVAYYIFFDGWMVAAEGAGAALSVYVVLVLGISPFAGEFEVVEEVEWFHWYCGGSSILSRD